MIGSTELKGPVAASGEMLARKNRADMQKQGLRNEAMMFEALALARHPFLSEFGTKGHQIPLLLRRSKLGF